MSWTFLQGIVLAHLSVKLLCKLTKRSNKWKLKSVLRKQKKKGKLSAISRGKFHLYEQEQNSEAIMKKKLTEIQSHCNTTSALRKHSKGIFFEIRKTQVKYE